MALPCDQCTEVLDFREARPQCKAHVHSNDAVCIRNLRAALAHERDRAKRVVRVFWRVRDVGTIGKGWEIETRREMRKARHVLANDGGDPVRIYRVTVRRKSK